MKRLPVEQQVVAFRVLPRDLAADVFEYLPLEAQERLLRAMGHEEVAGILNEMAPDDRTALLDELPARVTQQLLNVLTPEERGVAVTLLGYPEGSIGRLMTPDYVRVRLEWTMEHVLDHIRRYGHDSETLSIVYVIDDHGQSHRGDSRSGRSSSPRPRPGSPEVMEGRVVALRAPDAQESAIRVFREQDRVALPVTDSAGVLIGIVTVDDVLDVAESAATANPPPLRRHGPPGRAVPRRSRSSRWCGAGGAGSLSCSWARCSPPPPWGSSRMRSRARWCSPSSCLSSSRAAATRALRRPPW